MARIEQIELDAHRGAIVADINSLVEKYRAIFEWDVPDIDQAFANKLLLEAMRNALAEIEKELMSKAA